MRPHRKSQGGYTLVEIAVVMAVIGLIVGGISMAREVLREAEYSRIHNKFVSPWKQAYDLHYQRAGVVLGDNQIAPTMMVNGAETRMAALDGSVAGLPVNYDNTGRRICEGQGYARDTVGAGDPPISDQRMHTLLDRLGIRMPAGRAEGREDRYLYSDSNGNPVELQVCFQWNPDRTISGSGNVMVLRGLTPDLARKLDQIIDGKADALEGRFRQQNMRPNSEQTSNQRPGYEWGANNTYSATDDTAPTAQGRGVSRDEDRVVLVTGHWAMDQ